jgi:hypothetical protein
MECKSLSLRQSPQDAAMIARISFSITVQVHMLLSATVVLKIDPDPSLLHMNLGLALGADSVLVHLLRNESAILFDEEKRCLC